MRRGVFTVAIVLGGVLASAGHTATCTFGQKAQLEAAADAYAKKMPAARAAYFKTHKSRAAQATFVAKQKAALAALRKAASCDDSAPSSGSLPGPVEAPPPSANEHFVFSSEMTVDARKEITDDIAYAAQDEQTLLGVQFGDVSVFASTDPQWLAQQDCGFYGFGGDCVSQKVAEFSTGAIEGGPGGVFCDFKDSASTAAEKQKTFAHELFHALQYQLDGLAKDGQTPLDQVRQAGPVWMHEGAPEVVGYHVLGDRKLNFASYAASLGVERTKAKAEPTPLDQLLTVDQDRMAGDGYPLYMVAIDHLVSIAPNGIKSLATYYKALGSGAAWPDAFQQAFGMTVDAFYANFATYRTHL